MNRSVVTLLIATCLGLSIGWLMFQTTVPDPRPPLCSAAYGSPGETPVTNCHHTQEGARP